TTNPACRWSRSPISWWIRSWAITIMIMTGMSITIIRRREAHGIRSRRAGTACYPQGMVEAVWQPDYLGTHHRAGHLCRLDRLAILSAQPVITGSAAL